MLCGCAGGDGAGDRAKSGTVGTGSTGGCVVVVTGHFNVLGHLIQFFLSWVSPADRGKRLLFTSLAAEACMAQEQGPGKSCVCHRVFPSPLSETASAQ